MSISAIPQNLSAKFLFSGNFADQAQLSILSNISPLWYGPGGLGKTEMILTVLNTLKTSKTGMVECHPDMSVSDLFGGAIALTQKKKTEGNFFEEEITKESVDYEKGLMSTHAFFMEEMLDCPMPVLAALKAVMTNKKWDGKPSRNKLILGATNINPYGLIEELPPTYSNSYKALLQRFLVIEHNPNYEKEDFAALLNFQPSKPTEPTESYSHTEWEEDQEMLKEVQFSKEMENTLSFLAQTSGENGSPVSPRTFMWTKKLLQAAAYLRDASTVDMEDLRVLSLVGSFASSVLESLDLLVEEASKAKKAQDDLQQVEDNLNKIIAYIQGPTKNAHFTFLTGEKNAQKLLDVVARVQVTDSLQSQKKQLTEKLEKLMAECHKEAEKQVFVKDLF